MPSLWLRIFLLHTFFLHLLPKNLRRFLPHAPAPPLHHQPFVIHYNKQQQEEQTLMDPAELARVFQMFDHNGDGRISKKELNDSLQNLGIYIPDDELTQMIERIDVNGDGCVDIDEFGALYKSIMDGKDNEDEDEEEVEEDMREAFNVFDQNGDGFITFDELKSVLGSLGLKQRVCYLLGAL